VRYDAAQRAKARLTPAFPAAVNLPVWREVGPTSIPEGQTYGEGGNNRPPVSGRCVGIFIDPSNRRHLVLCTAGGGLWESLDAGATWRPQTDFQPVLAMGAIAHAPSSPNIVYAATGEGDTRSPLGMGLLRSSDAGLTWTHVPVAALAGTGVYDLAVDPVDPLHLWIGAVSGLFESSDGGATVSLLRAGLTWDISINPINRREVLVACDLGLLRTTNGGGTWSQVNLPGAPAGTAFDRMEVCHAPSNPAIVFVAAAAGPRALLWRRGTTNGAFAAQAVPTALNTANGVGQAWYDWCFAVSPANPNVVMWGAIELYSGKRSSASNWQWKNVSSRSSGDSIHPDQHHIQFDPVDPQTVYVCNDGGVFRSPDGGTKWESLNKGLGITEFEFLAHLESKDRWIFGGTQDNGSLSNDTGGEWDQVALGDGGDCAAIDGTSARCYHSYYGMWIERAAATGTNAFQWVDVSPPFPENYPALFYPPMDAMGTLLAKAGASLFVSANSGTSWSEVALPTDGTDLASALTIASNDRILVGTMNGRVYRIRRSSGGWGSATVTVLASPRPGFISDIVPVGTSNTLWASCSDMNHRGVLRSTNGGTSWQDRSGNLPRIPVNAIVVDPQNTQTVYAATDNGVYRTTNGGTQWIDFSNGLPNALVGDLILHARLRLLRAGTRNRGAWEVQI
jgi:photosystem II stability/assembly factor-like uncharacterized protein